MDGSSLLKLCSGAGAGLSRFAFFYWRRHIGSFFSISVLRNEFMENFQYEEEAEEEKDAEKHETAPFLHM